jgi:hypothetical protein
MRKGIMEAKVFWVLSRDNFSLLPAQGNQKHCLVCQKKE